MKFFPSSSAAAPAEKTASESKSFLNITIFSGRISTKDLALFSRQLAVMIRAGVPIVQALDTISRQTSKENFKNILQEMIADVKGGSSFSQAMSKHPKVFSQFLMGIIETGEASGQLLQSLTTLADYLERDYAFWRKLWSALAYPALILVTIVIVGAIVFTQVVPQLSQLFSEAKVELPLPTRIVIGVSNFIQSYWYILAAAAVFLGILLRSYLKTPEGRYTLSTVALSTPIIKNIFQKVYLSRLTSVLHTLLKSNVPILESLRLTRQSMGNRVYQRIMDDTIAAVKDGAPMSSVWEHEPYIPAMLSTIVGVGEKGGQVAESLREANRFFQRDVEEILGTITVLLEPLMVVMLGVGVAIMVAAVLLPIYNLVLVL